MAIARHHALAASLLLGASTGFAQVEPPAAELAPPVPPAPAVPAAEPPGPSLHPSSVPAAVAKPAQPESPAPAPVAAPAKAQAPAPPAAEPAVRSPAQPQLPAVAWYRPTEVEEADAALPWNTALGPFDPWTRAKVALLVERQSFELAFQGKPLFGGNDVTTYTGGTFQSSITGGRIEWGNWGIGVATGKGTLARDPTPAGAYQAGTSVDMDIVSGRLSRSFGAWAFLDSGAADMRLGLALPEVFLRFTYATAKAGAAVSTPGRPAVLPSNARWAGLQLGVSLVGVRWTTGDSLYVEARFGEVHAEAAVWELAAQGTSKKDQFGQWGWGKDFEPTFRAGLAF